MILHVNSIAHLDIKLGNIFFYEPSNTYFLCDFGATKKLKNNNFKNTYLKLAEFREYTPTYACPFFMV